MARALIGLMLGAVLFAAPASQAVEPAIEDVTFSTKLQLKGKPKTAWFYYNGRAVGEGRAAFESIVDTIGKLPAETSIVWGPNYDRCGACSGAEPGCTPKFLYPDLWEKLEANAKQRKQTLSSNYPSVGPRSVARGDRDRFSDVTILAEPPTDEVFDAEFEWQVHERRNGDEVTYEHRFLADGKVLKDYDFELFFGRLPEKSRVLVKVSLANPLTKGQTATLAAAIQRAWDSDIDAPVRRGKLQMTITIPQGLVEAVKTATAAAVTNSLGVDWDNFRGVDTPHEEVLYTINGDYVGRGDAGFDRVLARIRELPKGSQLWLPQYEYSGRYAVETMGVEERAAANKEARTIAPYSRRRSELEAAIKSRALDVQHVRALPGKSTVLSWNSGDRYGYTFVSHGRIIRHNEKPRRAAATLAWTGYAAGEKRDRQSESEAMITLNRREVGKGVAGFAKAMDAFAQLPPGSVVHVKVGLRTKGRFLCPLVYEGQRHFERSGFEPYFGMYPWLLEVAKANKLEIEWIPDEQESCGDCQLNR